MTGRVIILTPTENYPALTNRDIRVPGEKDLGESNLLNGRLEFISGVGGNRKENDDSPYSRYRRSAGRDSRLHIPLQARSGGLP